MPIPFVPSPSAQAPASKHRLFIAFPMFLALLGASVLSGVRAEVLPVYETENGSVLTVVDRPETVILARSVAARLMPGSIVVRDDITPILSEGEAVFAAAGCFTLSVGSLTLQGCGGAVHVQREGDEISIAALTTPVLVFADGATALVPVHRSWSAPAALHTPEEGMQRWIGERVTRSMTGEELRLRLPVATELLSDVPAIDPLSLQSFASTSTGWLLAAFHPETRDLAWTLPQPETMTEEGHLLSLLSFLPSDHLSEAFSAVAFDRWKEAVGTYLSTKNDVNIRVALQEQAGEFSSDDVPERAGRAKSAMEGL